MSYIKVSESFDILGMNIIKCIGECIKTDIVSLRSILNVQLDFKHFDEAFDQYVKITVKEDIDEVTVNNETFCYPSVILSSNIIGVVNDILGGFSFSHTNIDYINKLRGYILNHLGELIDVVFNEDNKILEFWTNHEDINKKILLFSIEATEIKDSLYLDNDNNLLNIAVEEYYRVGSILNNILYEVCCRQKALDLHGLV